MYVNAVFGLWNLFGILFRRAIKTIAPVRVQVLLALEEGEGLKSKKLRLYSIRSSIFRSKFWAGWRQKCYRNPFLDHFETPKECGRHCHRYLGKVKFFRVIWITKRCQKRDFCSGRALKAPPPYGRVNFLPEILPKAFWVIITSIRFDP